MHGGSSIGHATLEGDRLTLSTVDENGVEKMDSIGSEPPWWLPAPPTVQSMVNYVTTPVTQNDDCQFTFAAAKKAPDSYQDVNIQQAKSTPENCHQQFLLGMDANVAKIGERRDHDGDEYRCRSIWDGDIDDDVVTKQQSAWIIAATPAASKFLVCCSLD